MRALPLAQFVLASLALGLAAQTSATATLLATDADSHGFGAALALSGNRAVIGAPLVDAVAPPISYSAGAIYVFDESPSGWSQVQKIAAPIAPMYDSFGAAVQFDGVHAAVGTRPLASFPTVGYVAIYDSTPSGLVQSALVKQPGDIPITGFGWSIALDGDRLLVGAPEFNQAKGAAYVYERSGSQWNLTAELFAGGVPGRFGTTVTLDGTRALIAAPNNAQAGKFNAGSVFAFELEAGQWVQKQKLLTPLTANNTNFGRALAMDDDTAIISENLYVRAYRYVGGAWLHEQVFGLNGYTLPGVIFQNELALSGERAWIHKQWFERMAGGWFALGSPPLPNVTFPIVALDGERALIGGFPTQPPVDGKSLVLVHECAAASSLLVRVEAHFDVPEPYVPNLAEIGAIAASAGPTNRIELRFALNAAHASLDDCYDFRWVTVEVAESIDGVAIGGDAELGALPAITPPASVATSPLRYTDAEWATGIAQDGTVIRKEGSLSLFFDAPTLAAAPKVVRRFHTFLVARSVATDEQAPQTLDVLAGVAWEHDSATNTSRICGEIGGGEQVIAHALALGSQGCPGSGGCPGFAGWSAPYVEVLWPCAMLGTTKTQLSLASGGASTLRVDTTSAYAGALYLVLGSLGGTSPGLQLGPYVIALNPDAYFDYTLSAPNHAPLANSLGLLDASGKAQASFALPALSDPALAGVVVQHAVVVLDSALAPKVVGSPVAIALQP